MTNSSFEETLFEVWRQALVENASVVEMVWIGGHWWWFPGRQITVESQFQWKNGRAYLLEQDGAVEGILFAGEVVPD